MKEIKVLGLRWIGTRNYTFSLFECGVCGKQVERIRSQGRDMKSCSQQCSGMLKKGRHKPFTGAKNTHEDIMNRIKIDHTTGCWLWTGTTNNKGYGIASIQGKHWFVHRYTYKYFKGDFGSLHVLHKCDNPLCCNPDHLFIGTHWENMQDMTKKERSGRIVLSSNQVLEIRKMRRGGNTYKIIADAFNVSQGCVSHILAGRSWKHLK